MTTRKLQGPLGGDYQTDGVGNAVLLNSYPLTADDDVPTRLADHEARVTAAEGAQTSQGRGLLKPNVAAAQLLPLPKLLASPPTFTLGVASAATAISGSVRYDVSDPAFRFFGGPTAIEGGGYRSALQAKNNGSIILEANWGMEFEFYGDKFELELGGVSTSRCRMWVDNLGCDSILGQTGMATDSLGYKHLYEFSSVALRRIRFDFNASTKLLGIRLAPTHSIWAASSPIGPKVVVTGDSFAEGFNHWPKTMGWLLGWYDIQIVGKGSTGYLDTSAGSDTYRDRIQKDVLDKSPDIVIVSGGLNDNGFPAAAVQAEAVTLYQMIRNALPDAILIVSGVQYTNGTVANSSFVTTRDAIRAAANTAYGDGTLAHLYIEQMGGPYPYSGTIGDYTNKGWMTGTGRVGATTGSGNSDLFRDTDSTHPTQAGHDYRGYRHAAAIAAAMPILGAS